MLLLNFRQSFIHTYPRTHRKIVGEIVGEVVGEIVGETGASCTECLLEKQTSAKFGVGHVTVELPSVIHSYLPPYTS